jgi:uncharacterized protein YfdQ (DUF2303 family)
MLDKSAIQEIAQAQAINSANLALLASAEAAFGGVVLPDSFKLHDVEAMLPNRRRARGTMITQAIEDFAVFVKAHSEAGTTVFIDTIQMAAAAVLNLGTPAKPGHADNRANYNPPITAAFAAVQKVNRSAMSQQEAAEFLEDWTGHWKALHDNDEMSIPAAIAAVRNITIEALRKAEATVSQLSASQSAFEQVKATSGANKLPTHIYFTCVPYLGFEERLFVLRLGIRTGDKAPAITLRIVNAEQHTEQMGQELADKVRTSIGDSAPVHLGSYSAK